MDVIPLVDMSRSRKARLQVLLNITPRLSDCQNNYAETVQCYGTRHRLGGVLLIGDVAAGVLSGEDDASLQ